MKKNKEIPIWIWVVMAILVVFLFYFWTRINENCTSDSTSYDPSNPLEWPFNNYPENMLNVYTQLRNSGYEVKGIQDVYDDEATAIMYNALGSDIVQIRDGFWALYVYIDKQNIEKYKVQLIKEDETCFYEILDSDFRDMTFNPQTSVSMFDIYDEGVCIE